MHIYIYACMHMYCARAHLLSQPAHVERAQVDAVEQNRAL